MKQKQKDRELWWLPSDFFTFSRDDTHLQHNYDHVTYKFKGYVCPECSVVYQFTPESRDEPLIDFPTYGKDRKICRDCV